MSTPSPRPSPFASFAKQAAPKPSSKVESDQPEEDEDDEDLEDDPNDDEATRKSKKAKKAKAGEEDDKKDDDDAKCRAARQRERARCAAIFSSPEAARNIVATCHVAFMTSMTRGEAVRTLAAVADAKPGAATPAGRSMADQILAAHAVANGESAGVRRTKRHVDTADAPPTNATAAAILAAAKKARGEA